MKNLLGFLSRHYWVPGFALGVFLTLVNLAWLKVPGIPNFFGFLENNAIIMAIVFGSVCGFVLLVYLWVSEDGETADRFLTGAGAVSFTMAFLFSVVWGSAFVPTDDGFGMVVISTIVHGMCFYGAFSSAMALCVLCENLVRGECRAYRISQFLRPARRR